MLSVTNLLVPARHWLNTPCKPLTWLELRGKLTTDGGRVVLAIVIVVLLLFVLPWYAKGHKDKNSVVTYPNATLINPILAGIAGAIAAWVALKQVRVALSQAKTAADRHVAQTEADRQRRVTDTFSKAVEHLGSDKMEVRVGGIYTLERLAHEALASPQDAAAAAGEASDLYWTMMETLTAFVRARAPWKEPDRRASETACFDEAPRTDRTAPATDIVAVLSVIRRRPEAGRARENKHRRCELPATEPVQAASLWRFDLRATDLRAASLRGAHLEEALLMGTHLGDAHLRGAHLERAHLRGAHLEGVDLSKAIGLTQEQIDVALGNAATKLPAGLTRPAHWSQSLDEQTAHLTPT